MLLSQRWVTRAVVVLSQPCTPAAIAFLCQTRCWSAAQMSRERTAALGFRKSCTEHSIRSALCSSSVSKELSFSDLFLPFFLYAVGGEIPLDMRLGGGQLVSEELMNLGESFTQTNDPSLKLFQCAVCNKFTTDNLDMLGLHMNVERSLPEDEWKAVMGDSYQCKLCRYNTQLKANFQLHCKTDKHVQKYQLVAHIKEGGKANEWRLKCVAIGNPVHLKCNACDYYTNSLEKLRLHTVNSRHEASLKLYKVSVGFASSSFIAQVLEQRKIYFELQWIVILWRRAAQLSPVGSGLVWQSSSSACVLVATVAVKALGQWVFMSRCFSGGLGVL